MELTLAVMVTVEIADEDWDDPTFQEMWNELIEEEIIKVVRVERARR